MKDYKLTTKQKWESEIKEHVMLYPDERVVAFAASNYGKENNSDKTFLDIGFGSGRNMVPFLEHGFQCYGIDYNEECCKVAGSLLSKCGDLKKLVHGSLDSAEFPEEFFDTIIVYGVLFLSTKNEMKQQLDIIYKLLKNGGKFLVNFRADDDFLNGLGEKIDDNSYIIDHRAKAYEGSTYTFLTIDEAISLLSEHNFNIIKKEKIEFHKNDLKEKHSWWILSVQK